MTAHDVDLIEAQSGVVCAIPRASSSSSVSLLSGRAVFVGFTPSVSQRVTALVGSVTSTAAATITLARLGLYTVAGDGALTLVARGPASTSLGNSTFSGFSQAFATSGGYPASYDLVAGNRYALAAVWVGTTPPTLYGASVPIGAALWLPWLAAFVDDQTDLATSYTYDELSGGNAPFLAAVR